MVYLNKTLANRREECIFNVQALYNDSVDHSTSPYDFTRAPAKMAAYPLHISTVKVGSNTGFSSEAERWICQRTSQLVREWDEVV